MADLIRVLQQRSVIPKSSFEMILSQNQLVALKRTIEDARNGDRTSILKSREFLEQFSKFGSNYDVIDLVDRALNRLAMNGAAKPMKIRAPFMAKPTITSSTTNIPIVGGRSHPVES